MVPAADFGRIRRNLDAVRARIDGALERSGRPRGSVTLVGVTKLASPAEAAVLFSAGCQDLGENRPEQLLAKAHDPNLQGATWHMIGTYQRRKIRDTLAVMGMVHSIDSLDLAAAVSRRAIELGRRVPSLIQVNVSGESSKQGLSAEGAARVIDSMLELEGLHIRGLMTMAPVDQSEQELRAIFASCRNLRDSLAGSSLDLPFLSMGMSSDFVPAILEGATHVRIGTSLFAED